jgi:diguanylate cyclase (GGDEF)-like protein
LLLFAWLQNTAITAVAWWGFAHLLRAGSIMLFGLHGSAPDLISIDLANSLLFTAFAVTWTGARVFDHHRPLPILLFGGAALWLVACRLPIVEDAWDVRVLLSCGIIAAYTWATAYEFWRGRSEPLVSRWPAIFMLFADGSLYLLRTPLGAMLPWLPTSNQVFESVWMTVLSFEALLFTIAIAFILLAMAKERTEYRHKTAALIDPLTGIANRRAFLEDGEAQLKRQATDPRPTAVMLLDLDSFKSINDRYGHAIGDRVLEIFAGGEQLSAPHRSVRRLGGEFAAVLFDTTASGRWPSGKRSAHGLPRRRAKPRAPGPAAASVGIVISRDAVSISRHLWAGRPCALPRQDNGRNRVEVASIELDTDHAKRGAADLIAAAGVPASGKPAAKSAA